MIHDCGPAREGPFVPVNCGAIPTELMESEFFGHKRGSFTGAVSRQDGPDPVRRRRHAVPRRGRRPAAAHAGEAAARRSRKNRAPGRRAARRRPIDVRILSATHKNLARAWWRRRQFREDLFYRINVIELRVPALRERRGDIAEDRAKPSSCASARPHRTQPAPVDRPRQAVQTASDLPLPRQRARAGERTGAARSTLDARAACITPGNPQLRATARRGSEGRSQSCGCCRRHDSAGRASWRASSATPSSRRSRKTRYNRRRRRKLLGHELSRAALSDQEAGHRVRRRCSSCRRLPRHSVTVAQPDGVSSATELMSIGPRRIVTASILTSAT